MSLMSSDDVQQYKVSCADQWLSSRFD